MRKKRDSICIASQPQISNASGCSHQRETYDVLISFALVILLRERQRERLLLIHYQNHTTTHERQ